MRPARARRDAVRIAPKHLISALGPLKHDLEPRLLLTLINERLRMDDGLALLFDDPLQIIRDAVRMFEDLFLTCRMVDKGDLEPFMQVALGFERLTNERGIEFRALPKDLGIGAKMN